MKFIKNLFTKPVKSTEFNPGRRAALGAAGAGAAAVAVGAKHAVKQAPEVAGRSKEHEEFIAHVFEQQSGGRSVLPLPKGAARNLGITPGSNVLNYGPRAKFYLPGIKNDSHDIVRAEDYFRAGGAGTFVIAKHTGSSGGMHILPGSFVAPKKKMQASEARKYFPRLGETIYRDSDTIEFLPGKSVVDIMETSIKTDMPVRDSYVFDAAWVPVRPDIRKATNEGKKNIASRARQDLAIKKETFSGNDQASRNALRIGREAISENIQRGKNELKENIRGQVDTYRELRRQHRGTWRGN